jgi:cytochrome oxidase Cu insertion factor (SCO1/SenC/PrrC family)
VERFGSAVGVVVVVACLACGAQKAPRPPPPTPAQAAVALATWRPGEPIPDVPLVDASGAAFGLAAHRSAEPPTPLLLGFAFSRCAVPTACPALVQNLQAVSAATGVPALVVSLDPTYDTPAVLEAWAARAQAPDVTFATGADGLVNDALPSLFNVITLGTAPAMTHGVKAALLDKDGRVRATYSDNAPDNAFDAAAVNAALASRPGEP